MSSGSDLQLVNSEGRGLLDGCCCMDWCSAERHGVVMDGASQAIFPVSDRMGIDEIDWGGGTMTKEGPGDPGSPCHSSVKS